jgi:hypothetical protein
LANHSTYAGIEESHPLPEDASQIRSIIEKQSLELLETLLKQHNTENVRYE